MSRISVSSISGILTGAVLLLLSASVTAVQFSPAEVAAFGKRSAQSVAGALALKRALVRIWADAGEAHTAPRDFELGHLSSGAPRLVAAPAGVALADVFVSISHTRQWAYGLAAAGRR